MATKYTRPRGTQDVLPTETWKWVYMENTLRNVLNRYGYREIRMPTFESTEVFARGVGDNTDIVSKEMYTFEDKGGRSMTLRPEGTSGVVRATLENGLISSSPTPLKTFYLQSCFRYEKAQKGRLREFHQAGIECFGTQEPAADVETMQVAHAIFREFGVAENIALEINAIGCPKCRPVYHKNLKEYLTKHKKNLCDTCKERLVTNPMRVLDCKETACQKVVKDAPVMLDYLCEDCVSHFEKVKNLLNESSIEYRVNPHIVRGLDYYSNTVYEFIAEGVGTQGTVCGGGRYNGLIEELGGKPTPAVGFGMGMERLLMVLEEQGKLPAMPEGPLLYAVGIGSEGRAAARRVVTQLREAGLAAEVDLMNRSVKAQMKAAGRLHAQYTIVLGDDEAKSGRGMLKYMADGTETEIGIENPVESLNATDINRTITAMGGVDEETAELLELIDAASRGEFAPVAVEEELVEYSTEEYTAEEYLPAEEGGEEYTAEEGYVTEEYAAVEYTSAEGEEATGYTAEEYTTEEYLYTEEGSAEYPAGEYGTQGYADATGYPAETGEIAAEYYAQPASILPGPETSILPQEGAPAYSLADIAAYNTSADLLSTDEEQPEEDILLTLTADE